MGKNLIKIVHWLNSLPNSFDIICFQEFPNPQIEYLKKNLKHYNYHFEYATSFVDKNIPYGVLTLIYKKIEIVDTTIIPLGGSFIEAKFFGKTGERSALVTALRKDGQAFLLINTHLTAITLNKQRRAQLGKILEHIASATKNNETPLIILGDLNYSSLVKQNTLFHLMRQNGFNNSHREKTHRIFSITSHQLDYIFYRKCSIANVSVLKVPYSDHFPTTFTLDIG